MYGGVGLVVAHRVGIADGLLWLRFTGAAAGV